MNSPKAVFANETEGGVGRSPRSDDQGYLSDDPNAEGNLLDFSPVCLKIWKIEANLTVPATNLTCSLIIGEETKIAPEKREGSEVEWEGEFHFHLANQIGPVISLVFETDAAGTYATASIPVESLPLGPMSEYVVALEPAGKGLATLHFGLALVNAEALEECD
jgi:hypothetical protein